MPFEEYASVRATHEQRPIYNVETGIVKENGNVIWTNVSAVPVDFPDWKVVIVTSDITERKQAEEALRESEERFSRLSAVTVEGIVISEQGKVIDANDQYARLLGYEPGELIGRSIVEMVAPESRDLVMANVRANVPGPYEHLALKKDGSLLPVEIRAQSISYKGRTARVTVIRDMSERKQAEQELRASEARFRALIENATDMVRVLDPSGVTVYVSPSTKRIMGYELEEMLGRSAFELVHPDDLTRVKERWQRAVQLQASTLGVIEARVRHADGTWHIHEAIGTNLLNDPSVRGFVMNTRDVTERKQHEQALRESEVRYRAIFDGVRDAIFVETLSGQILDVNARACEMFGYSREEFLNKQVTDLVPPGHPVIMPNDPAGQEFLNRSVETVNLRANGQPFPVEINGRLQTINGETCLLVVVRDITERKRAEETTRSLAKFPAENPNPVVRLNAAGIILYANEASEVLLREWNCTVGDPAPAMWRELCTQALAARARHTLDYEYGGEVYSFVITPIVEFSYVNLYAINVTVRKQAEEASRRTAQRLELLHHIDRAMLTAQSPEAIAETALLRLRDLIPFQRADVVLFDADEMLVLATVPLTGTALHSGLKLPIEPDWLAELQRGEPIIVHDLSAFTSQLFSVQVLEAEGMQSLVNIPLLARGLLIGMLNLAANTLNAFKPEHVDIATEVADQIAVMIQQARLHEQVQRHADELEIRVAERTRELSIANEQLKELDRAKDQFVSNVSHELRTPLANLKLYLSLLDQGRTDKREEYMQTLRREHGRLDKMIEDLLDLSRLDLGVTQIQPAPTDLNLLLSQLIGDRTALAAEHQLVLDYQPYNDLPLALIDPVMLMEVITNLVGNAVNYTPAGGMITVITATREHEGQTWVTFTVQDNGLGISLKDMPHLFERFYRGEVGRKADAPGTGLGLAICEEIVDRLGGHITVESEPEHGSAFTVWLKPAK
jgi:PAS domain S-box-containing protein